MLHSFPFGEVAPVGIAWKEMVMSAILKGIGALIFALIVWFVVATAVHRLMCVVWPAYAVASPLLNFTLPMKIARLSLGAVSTLIAGATARRLSAAHWVPVVLGCALLVLFLPEHISLWNRLPVWYHLTFLLSLIPLTLLGARLPSVKPT
jgi:hypothetical protein